MDDAVVDKVGIEREDAPMTAACHKVTTDGEVAGYQERCVVFVWCEDTVGEEAKTPREKS